MALLAAWPSAPNRSGDFGLNGPALRLSVDGGIPDWMNLTGVLGPRLGRARGCVFFRFIFVSCECGHPARATHLSTSPLYTCLRGTTNNVFHLFSAQICVVIAEWVVTGVLDEMVYLNSTNAYSALFPARSTSLLGSVILEGFYLTGGTSSLVWRHSFFALHRRNCLIGLLR